MGNQHLFDHADHHCRLIVLRVILIQVAALLDELLQDAGQSFHSIGCIFTKCRHHTINRRYRPRICLTMTKEYRTRLVSLRFINTRQHI